MLLERKCKSCGRVESNHNVRHPFVSDYDTKVINGVNVNETVIKITGTEPDLIEINKLGLEGWKLSDVRYNEKSNITTYTYHRPIKYTGRQGWM